MCIVCITGTDGLSGSPYILLYGLTEETEETGLRVRWSYVLSKGRFPLLDDLGFTEKFVRT